MDTRTRPSRQHVLLGRVRGHRGFTLVELMISLLVLAVLMAVAMPYYGDWRNRTKNVAAQNDIVGNEAKIETYLAVHQAMPVQLSDVPMAALTDPWGRPYVFYDIAANGKGGARKDHALNPLNTDYDLYSSGADGVSKAQITQKSSVDDVIRASNGGFVGLASDF